MLSAIVIDPGVPCGVVAWLLDIADNLGIQDVKKIVSEAKKQTDEES
jgi:hypothetical protein